MDIEQAIEKVERAVFRTRRKRKALPRFGYKRFLEDQINDKRQMRWRPRKGNGVRRPTKRMYSRGYDFTSSRAIRRTKRGSRRPAYKKMNKVAFKNQVLKCAETKLRTIYRVIN